jgi:SAM-dependent methyltransferase
VPDSWEWETEDEMQELLAGYMPRARYLERKAAIAAHLAELFELDGTQRGFEIGSGEGIVARTLAPRCRSLDCTDVSRSFLERARGTCQGVPNVRFHRIGDDYLDFLPADTFDFGFATAVFIHLDAYDIYHYLCSARTILKPGGLFYFNVATLCAETRAIFREHAQHYRRLRDPAKRRTLMRWNDLSVVRAVVDEADLTFRGDKMRNIAGRIGMLVEKPAADSPSRS